MAVMMVLSVLLTTAALMIALPAIVDALALLRGLIARSENGQTEIHQQPLLFLVPAHNESLLIARCVSSLSGQAYPPELRTIVVLADNCTDDTATLAREAGATVLERSDVTEVGKGHAIGWALRQLPMESYAALVIVDADTIVESDFAASLAAFGPLEERAIQTFDGASNEFETALTRMAGLLTRNRYDIALPIKARAHLSCPLTGDGVVLGRELLKKHPWRTVTITEGWEMYARLTLAGKRIDYAPRARLYAQETRSLVDSGSQRQRWTTGRLAVFKLYLKDILLRPGISLLQRLDLLAELSSLGPVVRGILALVGVTITGIAQPPGTIAMMLLFASGVVQPALYSVISLVRHPQPGRTLVAFLRLPPYAIWRLGVGLRALIPTSHARWVRTRRREEAEDRNHIG